MSFIDNFSFAFQDISLYSKSYIEGKYGINIEDVETQIDFRGVIQEKKDIVENYLGRGDNIKFISKDFLLRSPSDILPNLGDRIESNGNSYDVIFPDKVFINGVHDHNVCIIRLNY